MRHLIFALAAATVALTPIGAAAQSPLGFFFQALNPSAAVAPPPAPGERRVYAPTAYQRPPNFPAPQARNAPPPPPFRGFWSNDWRQRFAAVPPQTPEKAAVPEHLQRQRVAVDFNEQPGTVIIDTNARYLYLIQEGGMAMRYGVGVGREGFGWNGTAKIGHKAEWPTWTPPEEMRRREPWLPESMEGGLDNPLGARALYLYEGSKDTLYRIHGTNQPETIGQAVSSGCIRMLNDDVVDLYQRVPIGTKVVVI